MRFTAKKYDERSDGGAVSGAMAERSAKRWQSGQRSDGRAVSGAMAERQRKDYIKEKSKYKVLYGQEI